MVCTHGSPVFFYPFCSDRLFDALTRRLRRRIPPDPRRYITSDQDRRIIICKCKRKENEAGADPPQGALVPSRYRQTQRPLAGRSRINYGR